MRERYQAEQALNAQGGMKVGYIFHDENCASIVSSLLKER